ncbi:GNAT family N-acetyltransferase [Streptomyces sp. SLBN-31]|jgi:GNAT superfamily N-acetyltransferase|uniref:GNAT family N-acetyltransferase n=1 Tax=Streptomyces sp. SLBN-31 TaxID=2768444 RepID=UPI001153F0BE|nr:GNAT family N-acetyltransferase [Streptomyces sp. SLBN-31]TQJ88435.1 L-amino acid N-acyltransferase YncA [Streptomyces sp. SLBN-31]
MPGPDSPITVLRPAVPADVPAVAAIWRSGWCDGHRGHVPDELVAVRTPASFAARAAARVGDTVVATRDGAVAGFVVVVGDEVEQLYVAAEHRGAGVAGALLARAEEVVRRRGHRRAWLAVVAGNARARRFYERQGWADEGPFEYAAEGPGGPVPVPCHRYVKQFLVP